MKKILYSLAAVTLLLTASCQDKNEINTIENPVQSGDEITFGSSLPEDIQSRTIYGQPDTEKQVFPVYWENGDEIAIYCPQASNPPTKLARYRISAPTTEPYSSTATAVTRIGDAGLQWGTEDLHKFYAFYPSSGVKGTESTGFFDLEIPVNQDVNKFYLDKDGNWQADVNTELALMYAYRGQKKSNTEVGTNIDLRFKPLSTILEIVVQGPANGTEALTLTNINVETTNGTPIVGQFHAQIATGSNTDEAYTDGSSVTFSSEDDDKVVNNLSIECSWKEDGETKFVTLGQGQKLYVKAFMLPTQEIDSKNIKITVSTTKGALHKTLVGSDGKSFTIAQHKVNHVTLPALKTDFETAYWMNSLDPNIYLTELSIPGSKMTAETAENGASNPYQATTIEQQYKDGVRAFILQTQRNYRGDLNVSRINKPLTTVLDEISNYLKTSKTQGKNEFAFVLITYNSGSGSQKDWMTSLQTTINEISEDVIYKQEITPNTTLGDVFGKIVVKCNYNEDEMVNGLTTSAPMLYTQWLVPYVEGGLDMPWGNPFNATNLKWLYQEVTTVTETDKNTCSEWEGLADKVEKYKAEDSKENKVAYIKDLFKKSLDAYKSENHNTWFMNDLGGEYRWCTDQHDFLDRTHDIHIDVETLTKDLNQLGIDELQNRAENAGLGLIFMNFANRGTTGQAYKSDLLLQTIIDNNFKFALRKKPTRNTPAPSYDASYNNGGNAIGWDK